MADGQVIIKKKKKLSLEEYQNLFIKPISLIDNLIKKTQLEATGKGLKELRNIRNQLLKTQKKAKYISNKKSKTPNEKKICGFTSKNVYFSDELCEFLNLKDTKICYSRIDAIRAISVYIKFDMNEKRDEILKWKYLNENGKRNLQDPKNKKKILCDKKLNKLLKYDQYVKDVEEGKVFNKKKEKIFDSNLYYQTISKLISVHILKNKN